MARTARKIYRRNSNFNTGGLIAAGLLVALAVTYKRGSGGGNGGGGGNGTLLYSAGAAPGGTPDTIDKIPDMTIMGGGEPARIVPVTPDAFIINGATAQQSQLAYDYYQEMLNEYLSKAAAYQAAGKPPPAYSFQTGYWALVLPEITDARAYIYSTF